MSTRLSELLKVCAGCGSCLSSCPVYLVTRDETYSPRGKIAVIKALEEGRISPKDGSPVLSFCSLCGGCENVCPNGIRTIEIIVEARKRWARTPLKKAVVSGFTKGIFPAHLFTSLAGLFFPEKLPFTPSLRPFLSRAKEFYPGGKRGRVLLFVGCLTNRFFPSHAEAMVKVLTLSGYDVFVPKGQICCGFPHLSLGDKEEFQKIMAHNRRLIDSLRPDFITSPCPTGMNTLRRFYGYENVRDLASLVLQGEGKFSKLDLSTTWHDPCHLRKEMGIWVEPREVLSSISRFREMEKADLCCGFGGSFSLSHPEISFSLRKEKRKYIRESGAEVLVTACPGCIMFLGTFSPIPTMHLAEFLLRAVK